MIFRHFPLSRMAIGMLMAFGSPSAFSQTSDSQELVAPTVEVSASADASGQGLPPEYEGGQVATGGRAGVLGNLDYMSAPFNSMNYTSEFIKNEQAGTIADVLQADPSVRIARGFGNLQELYIVRGLPLASDDMMYNGLYGVLPRQFIAAELVERVEVLRGANSFMNGASPGLGAGGGIVNLLPKRAPNDPLSQVTIGVENGGEGYLGADFGRRFGPDGSSGLRLNAAVRNGDRSIDDEHRELGVFAIGLDHQGENFRLSADVGFQDYKLENPRPSLFVTGLPVPDAPDASGNFGQPWTYSIERDTFGTLRGEVDLTDDIVAWAAFGARRGSEDNLLSGPFLSNPDGDASQFAFANTREDSVATGEVGARVKFQTGSIGHTLAANVSMFSFETRAAFGNAGAGPTNIYNPVNVPRPVVNPAADGGDFDSPRTTQETDLLSVAVADTLSFIEDRLLVTLGLRHQQIEDKTFQATTGAQQTAYDDDAVTPLLGIVFKVTPAISVYGNYVESLAKGLVAFNSFAPFANQGEAAPPAKTKQKEVGIKYDGGNVGAAFAIFTAETPTTVIENNIATADGRQRNRGAEFTVFGSPAKGVRVLGGVTLLDSELRNTAGGANDGNEAIGVPDTQLNLGGEWDLPGMERLTLTGRVLHTASQYMDDANDQEVPSWTRLDVGARYVMDFGSNVLTLRGAIENVTDENYWASAGGYPQQGYLVLGMPRTIQVSASLDF